MYFHVGVSASFLGNDVFGLGLQLMSHAENETLVDESLHLVYSQQIYVCMLKCLCSKAITELEITL